MPPGTPEGRYLLHPAAVHDLEEIWGHVADDNLDAADRIVGDLFDAFDRLALAPYLGHRRPDLATRALRFWVVREYLVAYASDAHPLWIIGVIHGRRNPRLMAAILRER